jgi:signal peptidase I
MTTSTVAALAARWWLVLVFSLLAWALAPVLIGWRPVVVVSGSMAPAAAPGDVAVVDPRPGSIRVGDIVLVPAPGPAARLLLHRVARIRADGALVTKGDANADVDSTPVLAREVKGRVRFVVPAAGRFAALADHPYPVDWAWVLLTGMALIVTLLRPRGARQGIVPQAAAAHR